MLLSLNSQQSIVHADQSLSPLTNTPQSKRTSQPHCLAALCREADVRYRSFTILELAVPHSLPKRMENS